MVDSPTNQGFEGIEPDPKSGPHSDLSEARAEELESRLPAAADAWKGPEPEPEEGLEAAPAAYRDSVEAGSTLVREEPPPEVHDIRRAKRPEMRLPPELWKRIREKIEALEGRWSIDWLGTGSSVAGTTAIGCVTAAFTVPSGADSGIAPAVKPGLLIFSACCLVFAATCLVLHTRARKSKTTSLDDIVKDMKAHEETFEREWGELRGAQ
jgi:hypothetical protein